jgi:hypothetical protein
MLGTMLVTGCDKADDRICGGLAMKLPEGLSAADNRKQIAFACVERWAARLSAGDDSASEVAEAALGACDDAIQFLEMDEAKAEGRDPDMDRANSYWRREAVFRAVQWRAGNCGIERAS